ncbi:MAG TPA: hypothetical protein VM715_15710 [Candidatus Acidoferrum sp.]|jgi:hypothetical protein|nr:hypothetical protein [Candidatus Acidoferrum sp.]
MRQILEKEFTAARRVGLDVEWAGRAVAREYGPIYSTAATDRLNRHRR